ncbi:hypothetical protein BOX15_Mlig011759g2 [Macrostomum lignano]|uniref:Tubulin--tyrosine ligase-like protein 12 SET-like domain-containing protein n=1 Tax=Macrostomum lignano TaxID=282301 RepID=A0A267G7I9_9PLAT|nr:hypothetical protein BOX15_Mlig011759g2 [Macrostomum lignano]
MQQSQLESGAESYEEFERLHSSQLTLSGLPKHYWPTLHRKISAGIYDAGDNFCRIKSGRPLQEYCPHSLADDQQDIVLYDWRVKVVASDGIRLDESDHVYLIDHFFSFLAENLDAQLAEVMSDEKARSRLEAITFPGLDEADSGLQADKPPPICREHVWRLASFYRIQRPNASDAASASTSVWYVMDEFGSSIRHSDAPSVKVFPFLHLTSGTAYSVMFPLRSLALYDEATRDWAEGSGAANSSAEPGPRQCRLLAERFHPQLFECFSDRPRLRRQLPCYPTPGSQPAGHNPAIFAPEFFARHRVNESLPSLERLSGSMPTVASLGRALRVFSNVDFVVNYLTKGDQFQLTEDPDNADILWLADHFKDYEGLSIARPGVFVNQFPFENVLSVKDLLASLAMEAKAAWYPLTFNLELEMDRFCAHIGEALAKAGDVEDSDSDDRYWIVKPWNMGRGLGIFLCDAFRLGLVELVKRCQATPCIASRYIHRPLLFKRDDVDGAGVKFDFRYMIILRSVRPLMAYVYKNFWLRFSNNPYSLDPAVMQDYGTHFTVMNYQADQALKNINCQEFVPLFDAQYGERNLTWSQIEQQLVLPTLLDIVRLAVRHPPPKGIAHNPQSRAIYAADLILGWDSAASASGGGISGLKCYACEVNFCPDLTRACAYIPGFMDHIFSTLFLNEPINCHTLVEEETPFDFK